MAVTFKTSAYANITMLGEVATQMLDLMGFGKGVPGAIDAADVPRALENLEQALDRIPRDAPPAAEADDEEPPVSLHTRARPLLELLRAAAADETHVRWE